jgi:YD repeat-containing protein
LKSADNRLVQELRQVGTGASVGDEISGIPLVDSTDPGYTAGRINFGYDDAGRRTSMQTPLLFSQSWSYNEFGELKQSVDGNGKVVDYAYDGSGRLEIETHSLGGSQIARIVRTYDGASNLRAIHDTVSGICIETTFDARNLPKLSSWHVAGGLFRQIGYGYL